MSHKIEISDRTYSLLKDYCSLNKLKIGQYADSLLYGQIMIEMYGNVPFTNYRAETPTIEETKPADLKTDFTELYEKVKDSDWFKETYLGKSLGDFVQVDYGLPPDEQKHTPDEKIEEEKPVIEKQPENIIPEKKKTTKRRLK